MCEGDFMTKIDFSTNSASLSPLILPLSKIYLTLTLLPFDQYLHYIIFNLYLSSHMIIFKLNSLETKYD